MTLCATVNAVMVLSRVCGAAAQDLWLLIAGFGAIVLAHTAPFPFLLEGFAPSRSVWHMPRDARAPSVYLTYDDARIPQRRRL